MSDLIERLRWNADGLAKHMAQAEFAGSGTHVNVKDPERLLTNLRDAAFEIVRLRTELEAKGDAVEVDVNDLAQEIRRVDGSHSLGAGALAEALLPFIRSALTDDKSEAAEERIRQDEREACARIAERQPNYPDTKIGMRQDWVKTEIATAIRARSRSQGGMGMGEANNETP